jgi:aminopeptidase-like protein
MTGEAIHDLARALWSFDRSITGEGVRRTMNLIRDRHLPGLVLHEVPSGTAAFDWTVPQEWAVNDAYLVAPSGRKICEFKKNNLHLVGYSIPVRARMPLAELQGHLYSLPEQPDAIPYVTSYYADRWGFCLTQKERDQLAEGEYEVVVDSRKFDGSLTYAELILPGASDREVFLSTYVCHPSMANNELSGPTVTTFLAKWLQSLPSRRYTYRIVFIPETIGSITYLSRNLDALRERVIAGFNITCVGDDRAYSFLPSRDGNSYTDRVARHVLGCIAPDYIEYPWSRRGSDERQYCAPGVDLPVVSMMRTKYGIYPEYHTSLDDLESVVTPAGLQGGYEAIRRTIEAIEHDFKPQVAVFGEPQLGKRGLYPTISIKNSGEQVRLMMDVITWSDGKHSLVEIAQLCKAPVWDLYPIVDKLLAHQLLVAAE